MFTFTDAERIYYREMRALSTDAQGREILVGLSFEETQALMEHRRKFLTGNRDRDNQRYFMQLRDKHELARLAVLGAEHELKSDNPTIN